MPRWSTGSVLALAPDTSSRRAAGPLSRPAPWSASGATEDLVWGLCAGSGKNPYQVAIDLSGPAFRCSCPSRKFPCKHALGLLLLWSAGTVPDAAGPAGYARDWQESRRDKQEKTRARSAARTDPADPDSPAPFGGGPDAGPGLRDEAAARRSAGRGERVAAGLADLQEWLRDQVRVGLASAAAAPRTGAGGRPGPAAAELMAARMVDAQAPGVAGTLRGLAGLTRTSGAAAALAAGSPETEWPARLLAEYGLLHLLARAHARVDALPAGLAATVRSRVGYPVARQDVLAGPGVPGRWLVVAVRDLTDGTVPGRRVWLREAGTGRWAMLLTFAAPNGTWPDPESARLRPGTEVVGDLHFYPAQPALRAVLGQHRDAVPAGGSPGAGRPPVPGGGIPATDIPATDIPATGIGAVLGQWAAALEQDPWLTTWPVLLAGTPVPPGEGQEDDGWLLADQAGRGLPLAARESLWTLLAVSGGRPVTVGGEWHPDGLVALTTWYGEEAVAL